MKRTEVHTFLDSANSDDNDNTYIHGRKHYTIYHTLVLWAISVNISLTANSAFC